MTIEETGPNHPSDHILDWLEDSVPFFSPFLDETNNSCSLNCYQWWGENQDTGEDLINGCLSNSPTTVSTRLPNTPTSHHLTPSELTKKRKAPDDSVHKKSQTHQNPRKNQNNQSKTGADKGSGAVEGVTVMKKSIGNKKNSSKSTGNNNNNGSNREGRWAEQLLNPCASAIVKGDATRVHHLLCVLQELASPTGDANHRLADHGLRALAHHLSSNSSFSSYSSTVTPVTFASTDPRFFQRSLIKFHEVSPWFAFPNNIANSSILHILSEEPNRPRNLHILDIGVSHGVQWPTLLEALTRRSGGPPPLIRLTVIAPTVEHDQNTETPFSIGPPGDNISSRLLSFAKSLNINLQINRLDNHSLRSLNSQVINKFPDEILIVCAQFRLHQLKHCAPDERFEFLQNLRKMEPKAVILSENNMACSCSNCGNFDTGFTRRVEYLWRFLDSTSSAFKGRESEERRVMEGEAAKALTNDGEMNEEKGKWCERIRNAGFERKIFAEDTIDTARASMRRYDNNWEMRVEEKDGCVGLWWKGQPVSFCSLWKLGQPWRTSDGDGVQGDSHNPRWREINYM